MLYFWHFFAIIPFHLVLGGIKDKVDSSFEFLLQSLWIASNLACWCILTAFKTDKTLITVCWYSSFWCHFDLVKQVRFGISVIFFRTHGSNGLKFDMLMYPDHIWNWLLLGHGLLVFLILAPFWLSETSQMCSFAGILMTMYERNRPKFVMFVSILWYLQKLKRQILAHENYPVTERRVSLTTV